MSTLWLIRHGQASFGADNYDVLSDLGVAQSRRLGEFLAHVEQRFDAVYVGPLQRQIDTAQHLIERAAECGAHYPPPIPLAGLNEYPAIALLRHWVPILRERDPAFRALLAPDADQGADAQARGDHLERAFHFIVSSWAHGELTTDHLQNFADFQAQVRGALQHIIDAQGRGKQVAVVTSGGVICMALQWALGLDGARALRMGWIIGNASLHEFRYRDRDAIEACGFNLLGHLRKPPLITYR